MDKKVFYMDCETTGLQSWKHDIIQLAFIIEINDEVIEEREIFIRPSNFEVIDKDALEIIGVNLDDLLDSTKYLDGNKVYKDINKTLSKYINKFDKRDKFTPAGFNVRFDCEFVRDFFKKNGDNYYGSFFNWYPLDGLYLYNGYAYRHNIKLENHKLSTICEFMGISIDAHDALSDIQATRTLIKRLLN